MQTPDDVMALRRNPLGIHASDGSDIVVGRAPRQTQVQVVQNDESLSMKAMRAKNDYYPVVLDTSMTPPGTLDDQLNELSIASGHAATPADSAGSSEPLMPKMAARSGNPQSDSMDLSAISLDFGDDFKDDMGSLLKRKRTISARPMPPSASQPNGLNLKTTSGPSKNPLLIQRLRSIRKRLASDSAPRPVDEDDSEDDVRRAEGLSDDILKMIAFSADSPWLNSEGFEEESDLEQLVKSSPSQTDATPEEKRTFDFDSQSPPVDQASNADVDSVEPLATPFELNPFQAAESRRQTVEAMSPSVTTLSSDLSRDLTRENSAEPSPKHRAVPPSSPTIQEKDPVSENDRGRLFLQINKIANIRGLPVDLTRHPRFSLSLDNGMQTVTTDPSPLPGPGFNGQVTAKVGQEFELTVAKDLELVLTVQVSMDALQPPAKPTAPRFRRHAATKSMASNFSAESESSPAASPSGSPKKGRKGMRNFLMRSPKKKQNRKFAEEQERSRRIEKQQAEELEEEMRLKEQYARDMKDFERRSDTWRSITGPGGEYCRGYLFESHYEQDIYGSAKSFALQLYNEWDRTSNGVPRPVCDLEITMMYVPKLFGSEQIPMSLRECQENLAEAKKKRVVGCEGFLTQQGGDCANMWRRRWFTLKGSEMVAYHEATRKRRALIHLENAVNVKDTLSDDLWCIYEDRSFQITFDDGEALSFYADTVAERDVWLRALRSSIANCTGWHRAWTDLVLERQEEMGSA